MADSGSVHVRRDCRPYVWRHHTPGCQTRGLQSVCGCTGDAVRVWVYRWPPDLRQTDLGDTAQCGDVHEAFLRLQEDADGGSPRRLWRPFSTRAAAAAAGAGDPGRCASSDSRGPTLRVTLRPMTRPRAGPQLLDTTMQSAR